MQNLKLLLACVFMFIGAKAMHRHANIYHINGKRVTEKAYWDFIKEANASVEKNKLDVSDTELDV